jgi:2-oxoglutarate ferredoxin oxidoreductase subunit alpha
MIYTIVFGGKAGQGPNILSEVVSAGLIEQGFCVFYSRDYQSLIRGGHNFNTLSFSENKIRSNKTKIDVLVCLDDFTEKEHKNKLAKKGIILKGAHENMFFAGSLYKLLNIPFSILEKELKKLRSYEQNIKEAKAGYDSEKKQLKIVSPTSKKGEYNFLNGNHAIAHGATHSGLEFYYAYPMTPATPLMMELGQMQLEKDATHKVIELENEIAVIGAAIGSSVTGALAMVGTSGGGFDLMTEFMSFAGQAEVPMVIYLSQRPGPGTGVATYTSQGDLDLALKSGHGEFQRIVIAPGDSKESIELTNEAFFLSQKFRIPIILLGDKHLGESKQLLEDHNEPLKITKSIIQPERFNSYERDEKLDNIATEDSNIIKANFERRIKKQKEIEKETEKFQTHLVYGNKESKNLVIFWGSTKGAVLDAMEELKESKLDVKALQIIFLEPFSKKAIEIIKNHKGKIILVENNSTSPLSRLITEKTGIFIEDKNKILRYDGRPFFSDELAEEIKKRVK